LENVGRSEGKRKEKASEGMEFIYRQKPDRVDAVRQSQKQQIIGEKGPVIFCRAPLKVEQYALGVLSRQEFSRHQSRKKEKNGGGGR